MPTERFDRDDPYDGHRRSGGHKKRAGRRQRIRHDVARMLREAAATWNHRKELSRATYR